MSNEEILLDEFTVPSREQWRAEVERLLKGAPFAERMFTATLEGIEVGPMYTASETDELPWSPTYPGATPYLRGARAAGYRSAPWLVCQELPYAAAADFNAAVLDDLARGQTAVNLVLAGASMRGTTIGCLADLKTALTGVDLEKVPLLVEAGAAALPVAAMILSMAREQGLDPRSLIGCLGCDPLSGLARDGSLPGGVESFYDALAVLLRWAVDAAPGLRTLPIHEDVWHEGGADSALSLGLVLAAGVQTLRALEARGLDVATVAPRFQFNLAIGSDFFLEIAKLRALRILWADVLAAAGCPGGGADIFIHASTSRRTMSRLDPHVNMLRVTTQAMSAVLGGTDSLNIRPFDGLTTDPNEFSRRIARNVHLILAHECHLDQVLDPAGGSHYVDRLTADLAARAWARLQEIERAGGLQAALGAGLVQGKIADVAAERANRLASRRDVLVGTNQYPAPGSLSFRATAASDYVKHEYPATSGIKEAGCGEAVSLVGKPVDILENLGKAARAGAGTACLVRSLHGVHSGDVVTPVPERRDAAPFEALRERVDRLRDAEPRAARVFCLCLGDVSRFMPRLDFVRGFFQVGGFEIVGQEGFADPAAGAQAAAADGARTVVIVGLDEAYVEVAGRAAADLATVVPPPQVYLAGSAKVPLVHGTIRLHSDLLEVLGRLVAELEGQP